MILTIIAAAFLLDMVTGFQPLEVDHTRNVQWAHMEEGEQREACVKATAADTEEEMNKWAEICMGER